MEEEEEEEEVEEVEEAEEADEVGKVGEVLCEEADALVDSSGRRNHRKGVVWEGGGTRAGRACTVFNGLNIRRMKTN